MSRSGTILIIVAGLSAVLAAMTVALLARVRGDAEESRGWLAEVQARAMLTAGLEYVCETARIGWDDPATPAAEEAFGWIDVRDGGIGPRTANGRPVRARDGTAAFDLVTGLGDAFPAIGRVARCPMRVQRRPPWAMANGMVVNAMTRDPSLPWSAIIAHPRPDPQPEVATWAEFAAGDPQPVAGTDGVAWFRVLREDVATFVVTCGAGATRGYAGWNEVQADSAEASFGGRDAFEELRRDESRLHFRCAWSAAVGGNSSMHYLDHAYHLNAISSPDAAHTGGRSVQMVGTIRWIQRLMAEPDRW
ncbi:MAG TPA: hypothetical protein VEL07_06155 [Planctomycetota bacterium]|nr:hypothetical protein [Planctomycetota bacterium]